MTRKKFINDWVKPILIAFIIFLAISTFFRIGEIDGESMYPTYTNGDKVIIFKHPINYEKGDIVVFSYAEDDEEFYKNYVEANNMIYSPSPSVVGEKHIKRIVGVPGDEIVIQDNTVYVNGEAEVTSTTMEVADQSYTLNDDEYFLMGDNTNNSYDSRMHGPVTTDELYGKLITNK